MWRVESFLPAVETRINVKMWDYQWVTLWWFTVKMIVLSALQSFEAFEKWKGRHNNKQSQTHNHRQ